MNHASFPFSSTPPASTVFQRVTVVGERPSHLALTGAAHWSSRGEKVSFMSQNMELQRFFVTT